MVDFGGRWYRSDLQRWLTKDPIGEEGGINLYAFSGNDPVDNVDIDGLKFHNYNDHADSPLPGLRKRIPLPSLQSPLLHGGLEFAKKIVYPGDDIDPENPPRYIGGTAPGVGGLGGGGKQLGCYVLKFQSGMKYIGKGTWERMQASIRRILGETDEVLSSAKFNPSKPNTDAQALMDEALKLRQNGGVPNPDLYNKINSPGENLLP